MNKNKETKIKKPKFVLNKKNVFKQVKKLNEIFDEISYSWKTNTDVGKILAEKNVCKFSIHGLNELKQFNKLTKNKINLNRIWYFGLALNKNELDILFDKFEIKNFVIDNEIDLNNLIMYLNNKNENFSKINRYKINILLRMKLRENTIFTGKNYVFGMKVNEVKLAINKLKNNNNINKIGIHFHRKTQNVSEWNLKNEIINSLDKEILNNIDFMNLGGGLPGNYKNIHDKSLESIFTKIKELKTEIKKYNIKLIIEPGRFIASSSIKLHCNILMINNNTIFLNVSIFNGMLDTILANVKLLVDNELDNGNKRWLLKGCSPDSNDILRYSVYLNKEPKIGDEIIFLNCGAYNFNCNFCALEKIETKIE